MTTWNLNHTFADFDKFNRYFVGSDKFLSRMQQTAELLANTATNGTYPPFNLKKTDENVYVIEMAVAGFGKHQIEMTLEDNKLIVKGDTTLDSEIKEGNNYLYKGIAERPFTRAFTLADNVEIKNAQLMNGMLKIWLEHIIPEHKKPKKIDIVDANTATEAASTSKKLPKE
jgi:molecular chaperone IbpA